MAWAFEQLLN